MAIASQSYSKAVLDAQQRRIARASVDQQKIQWFVDQVATTVSLTLKKRVRLACELLRTTIVRNISRPVTKTITSRLVTTVSASGKKSVKRERAVVVSNRSRPGEFPKADTTNLMKTIFIVTEEKVKGQYEGYVGTPVDYGVILELYMKRSFMVRTFVQLHPTIMRILNGPIPGGK